MNNVKTIFFCAILIAPSVFKADDIASDENSPVLEITPNRSRMQKHLEQQYLALTLLHTKQNLMALENEHAFLQCLEDNLLNSDRGFSGLPKICEESAIGFAIYNGSFALEVKISDYNNARKLLYPNE